MAASLMSNSLPYWQNVVLTSGIVTEPNPDTFGTTDCDKSTPIGGSCETDQALENIIFQVNLLTEWDRTSDLARERAL